MRDWGEINVPFIEKIHLQKVKNEFSLPLFPFSTPLISCVVEAQSKGGGEQEEMLELVVAGDGNTLLAWLAHHASASI